VTKALALQHNKKKRKKNTWTVLRGVWAELYQVWGRT